MSLRRYRRQRNGQGLGQVHFGFRWNRQGASQYPEKAVRKQGCTKSQKPPALRFFVPELVLITLPIGKRTEAGLTHGKINES